MLVESFNPKISLKEVTIQQKINHFAVGTQKYFSPSNEGQYLLRIYYRAGRVLRILQTTSYLIFKELDQGGAVCNPYRQKMETQTRLGNCPRTQTINSSFKPRSVKVLNLQELYCSNMEEIRNVSDSDSQTQQLAPQPSSSQTSFNTPYSNRGKHVTGNMIKVSCFKPIFGEYVYICFSNMEIKSHFNYTLNSSK